MGRSQLISGIERSNTVLKTQERMKNLILVAVCIFLYFVTVTHTSSIPVNDLEDPVLLSRHARDLECESKECQDCLGSCDGCNQCPLCAFCFVKNGPCEKCKYCTGDKPVESCKKKCQTSKQLPKCKACRKNCQNK